MYYFLVLGNICIVAVHAIHEICSSTVLCASSFLAKGLSINDFRFNSHYVEKLGFCINVSLVVHIDMIYSIVVHLNGAAINVLGHIFITSDN